MMHLMRMPLAGLIHLLFENIPRALNLGDIFRGSLLSLHSENFTSHCTAKEKYGDEA